MTLELATERMLAHVDEYGIGWMTFNNPARHNALSLEMWQGIGDILEYFQNSAAVCAVRTNANRTLPLKGAPKCTTCECS